ncbi:MAG: HEAT repeat domain-containing protein, partial [Planctomycetes bacterium]|nr:HEAT repeat domain-containing protein [Planctomycetota bacterium]
AMIPDPAAARTLCDALGDASGRPAARRIAIINALGHKDDDAAAQALAGEAESAEPVEVRLAALEALANSPMSYAYVHLFWSALPGPEEEKPRERRRVWDSMMNVGKAFISSGEVGAASDFGCELLDVAATREETCSAIVLLSHAGRRFAPERIIAALDHEDPQVRAAARSSLARLRGPLAVPTLKARLEKAAPAMQVELLAILARRDEPQAAALAASRLHHDDAAVRAAALRALETLGTAGAAAALIDALDEGSPAIREGAAGVLGRMEGEDVAREIVERSKTATGEIRAALLRALARRGEPAAEDPRRG